MIETFFNNLMYFLMFPILVVAALAFFALLTGPKDE
jgi:hypothetical protein